MAIKQLRVKVGERWFTIEMDDLSVSPVRVTVEGETFLVEVEPVSGTIPYQPQPSSSDKQRTTHAVHKPTHPLSNENVIRSPMPGRVIAIMVRPGDVVTEKSELCVVEAMKMEQSIRSPRDGSVKTVHVRPQQQVDAHDPLIELE